MSFDYVVSGIRIVIVGTHQLQVLAGKNSWKLEIYGETMVLMHPSYGQVDALS